MRLCRVVVCYPQIPPYQTRYIAHLRYGTAGLASRPWKGAGMLWTYLALAAGVLVLVNVLVVVVLMTGARRDERPDNDF